MINKRTNQTLRLSNTLPNSSKTIVRGFSKCSVVKDAASMILTLAPTNDPIDAIIPILNPRSMKIFKSLAFFISDHQLGVSMRDKNHTIVISGTKYDVSKWARVTLRPTGYGLVPQSVLPWCYRPVRISPGGCPVSDANTPRERWSRTSVLLHACGGYFHRLLSTL